jgi:hypothetical protein
MTGCGEMSPASQGSAIGRRKGCRHEKSRNGPLAQLAEQRTLNPPQGDSANPQGTLNPLFFFLTSGFRVCH